MTLRQVSRKTRLKKDTVRCLFERCQAKKAGKVEISKHGNGRETISFIKTSPNDISEDVLKGFGVDKERYLELYCQNDEPTETTSKNNDNEDKKSVSEEMQIHNNNDDDKNSVSEEMQSHNNDNGDKKSVSEEMQIHNNNVDDKNSVSEEMQSHNNDNGDKKSVSEEMQIHNNNESKSEPSMSTDTKAAQEESEMSKNINGNNSNSEEKVDLSRKKETSERKEETKHISPDLLNMVPESMQSELMRHIAAMIARQEKKD